MDFHKNVYEITIDFERLRITTWPMMFGGGGGLTSFLWRYVLFGIFWGDTPLIVAMNI